MSLDAAGDASVSLEGDAAAGDSAATGGGASVANPPAMDEEPSPLSSAMQAASQESDMPPIDLGPLLTFRVTHRKDLHHVTLPAAATVQQLHEKLEELTEIPVGLQKIMYKGGLKDKAKTLTEVGIKEGVKIMLMGSKPTAVKALADAGKAAALAPMVEQLQAEAAKVPLCEEKEHKRVLEKGKPADAEQGQVGYGPVSYSSLSPSRLFFSCGSACLNPGLCCSVRSAVARRCQRT